MAAPAVDKDGLKQYYVTKIEELQLTVADKNQNLRRLQAQRNELNAKVEQGFHGRFVAGVASTCFFSGPAPA